MISTLFKKRKNKWTFDKQSEEVLYSMLLFIIITFDSLLPFLDVEFPFLKTSFKEKENNLEI